MKILLIQPAKAPKTIGGEDYFLYEPLALEYLAAGVEKDHDVKILDMRIEKDLQTVLTDFSPHVIGITAYTVHVNPVINLCKVIKMWKSEILTIVGGHHATVSPEDFSNPYVDLVVMGEGVFVFKEIMERLEKKKDFDGISGIAYNKRGEFMKFPPDPIHNLDSFPFPNRGLTSKYREQYYSEWMKPLASIRTSKGCPFRCNFCALWKLTGGKYLKREPEKIVEELFEIREEFVFFADDESLVDVVRMKHLANLIKESGIKKRFFLYGRSDTIAKHPELLKLWKEAGLERVFVGFEFFREDDLKYINKGSTINDNDNAIKILNDLGIEIYASFIVRPEFSKNDFKSFIKYCRSLGINFPSFAILTPLPGTDFYEEVKEQLIIHNYDYFDFLHTILPTALPLKEFYQEFCTLYKKAIPFRKSLSLMRKFSIKDFPTLFKKTKLFYKQVRNAYRDYN
jgi:radical SAM superfamily enzyme YgiQ (UPF0313 family)